MTNTSSKKLAAQVFLVALGLLAMTRLPLAPRVLYHFDSGNFALAHSYFHPGLSRPHVPGDPLYVGLSRLLSLVTPTLQDAFTLSGVLAAAGAITFLFLLADTQYGRRAALLSSGLLFVQPALLTGGLTNPVRVYLALITTAGAWFGWQVMKQPRPGKPLMAGSFVMALLCGFRPEMVVLAAPLLIVPALLRRLRWPLVGAMAIFLLTAAPWAGFTVWRTGGALFEPSRLSDAGKRLESYIAVTQNYLTQQTMRDSVISGADAPAAFGLVEKALAWTFWGVAPALLLVLVFRLWKHLDREHLLLFGLWLLPCFLFHAIVHIADPDHALSTVPALCWLVGGMLGRWLDDGEGALGGQQKQWAAWGAVAACGVLFLLPNPRITEQASYPRIREQAVRGEALVEWLFERAPKSRFALLCHDSEYPWRNLSYYFAAQPLVYFPQAPAGAGSGAGTGSSGEPQLYTKTFSARWETRDGMYVLRNVDFLVWPLSLNRHENVLRESADGFRGSYVFRERPVAAGEIVTIGQYRFLIVND